VSLFDVLANGAQQLSLGPVGRILWPFSGTTVRIGVTGLSRAGKTAFLTSVAANLLARSSPRFALAPLGAGDVARFDEAGHLAALAADPPAWPARTNAVSLLALTTTIPRGALPGRQLRLEFLDYPGEWLIDLPLLGLSFKDWSRAMLKRLEAPACAALAGPFLAFGHALPAKIGADEALARAGARLYRDMLGQLRESGLVYLQPGRHLMPAPGPEPPWMEFFPLVAENGLADLLGKRYDAYVEAVRRDLASPLFADVDRLVILADVLSALHAGPAAFTDMSAALQAAAGSLRWEWSWLEAFAALRALRLPPRLISRVAFAATKADHVADRQRGNLAALMKALATVPSTLVKTGYFAIASVRCTEDFVWTLDGRPVSAVRGRVLGQGVMTRSYPGEVPDRPPDADFWEHPFLALPEFEPMRLPDGGRNGVPNIGLDALLNFLTEDVL
jgi:predicted YcjX-like family ATPase